MAITYHSGRRIQSVPDEYKVHEFTSSGTLAVTGSGDIEYLVVAGGGGGYCGGGGAGGMRTGTLSVSAGNKTVTVGAGGYSGQCNVNGHGDNGVGGDSVFDSITSTGGGFGGGSGGANNTAGGSSGGAGGNYTSNGGYPEDSVTPNQGNNGGASDGTNSQRAGAGGGAGAVGGNATSGVAVGGDGLASSISGSSVIYAGGGGGGFGNNTGSGTGGAGGSGGGGSDGAAGATNLGAGGGGHDNSARAGYGGSGIVIVRYLTSSGITATGGTITTINAHDARPLNVQLGSRLEETDTRKMYNYADPLTFESDFSSASGWTASDSNDIGVANGKLNWYNNGTNTYENAYYDLGSVSDTKWILRHTLKVSGTPSSDEIPYQFIISNTANANWNTSSSCLGVWVYVDRNNAWRRIYTANKVNSTSGGDNGAQASPRYWSDFAYGTTYYITTTRTSATNMTVEIRTGSHSGSIVSNGTLTLTIPSGITGLRYLTANQGAQGTGLSMEVDDVEFYNDTTSTDIEWKELGT